MSLLVYNKIHESKHKPWTRPWTRMKVNQLTEQVCKRFKLPDNEAKKLLADGNGLYLRVRSDGSKYWIVRLYRNKSASDRGIGDYPKISLAEARKKRDEYQLLWSNNQDPMIEKKKQRYEANKALEQSFEFIQNQTFKDKISKMSIKHCARWQGLYKNYLKSSIGILPLKEINDAIVLELIENIYKTKPQTALKVKNLISVTFNYAIEKKWFRGINPTKLLQGNSLIKKPKNTRMKYLEENRVGELMSKLANSDKEFHKALIYVLMVTGLRVGSAIKAKWSWFDGDVLKIPGEYMKNREAFICPLPIQAVRMLNDIQKKYNIDKNKYIFQSVMIDNSSVSDNSVRQYLQQILGDKYTLHGFRTLFNRVVTKSQKFNIEMIESQLTHAFTQTQIRRIYLGDEDYLDERRKIVQYFADWVDNQKKSEIFSSAAFQ